MKQSGVTLVILVITIIVMLILAGTSLVVGTDVIQNTKRTAFSSELQTISQKVSVYYEKGQAVYQDLGTKLSSAPVTTNEKTNIQKVLGITLTDDYRYFDKNNYHQIELQGIKRSVLINFKERQVISIKPIKQDGIDIYTLEQLGEGSSNITYIENTDIPTFDAVLEPLQDIWRVRISNIQYPGYKTQGTLQYRKKDTPYWTEIQGDSFEVRQPGIYEIQLVDQEGKESQIKQVYAYIKRGLQVYFDGENNTENGHDNTATTWKDLSGNHNDLILNNANSNWQSNSLLFDGTATSGITKQEINFNNTTEMTLDFVDLNGTLATNTTTGGKIIMELTENPNNHYGAFYIDTREYGTNDITLAMKYNVDNLKKTNHKMVNNIIQENKNQLFTLTFNSKKALNEYINIYYNSGNKAVTTPNNNVSFNQDISNNSLNNAKLYVGARNQSSLYAKMKLAVIRIYDRELSEDEIKTNYEIDKQRFNL